ncbi:MAG TPA: response regulator [Chitinispirillaceae bacterium]|nr:response regulator [Chitinispirillaceae bacterium]
MNILTVDDSTIVRELLKGAVEVLGYGSLEASDGQEALKILRSNKDSICLILLDWNMPIMSGIEFLRIIKSDPELASVPVTMVTSENEKSKIIEAITNGAKNYIIKPFTQEEIMSKILESLGMA